ncbi:MAG: hypothetical protein GY820_48100 [Gammaproteobacteria bacterium]|nr:hypothetical protein [Gammaproteobacteria bacterium]
MKNVVVLFICCIALIGCGRYSSLNRGTSEVKAEDGGVVIVSGQETNETRLSSYMFFYFDNLENDEGGTLKVSDEEDFDEVKGTRGGVFAFSLPAGNYAFNDWLIFNGGADITPRKPQVAEFTVTPGSVNYLGNLNMNLRLGENLFGLTMVFGGVPEIRDRFDRDIKIAKEKFPFLKDKKIHKKVLSYKN